VYQNFISYLFEARHVSGDTPPIIRSLKLHYQPLFLHTWRVVGRVFAGHWFESSGMWRRVTGPLVPASSGNWSASAWRRGLYDKRKHPNKIRIKNKTDCVDMISDVLLDSVPIRNQPPMSADEWHIRILQTKIIQQLSGELANNKIRLCALTS